MGICDCYSLIKWGIHGRKNDGWQRQSYIALLAPIAHPSSPFPEYSEIVIKKAERRFTCQASEDWLMKLI